MLGYKAKQTTTYLRDYFRQMLTDYQARMNSFLSDMSERSFQVETAELPTKDGQHPIQKLSLETFLADVGLPSQKVQHHIFEIILRRPSWTSKFRQNNTVFKTIQVDIDGLLSQDRQHHNTFETISDDDGI